MATPHDPSSPGRSGMPEFEWHPADLLRPRLSPRIPADTPGAAPDESDENGHIRFALVVLNQPFHTHLGMVRQLWDNGECLSPAPLPHSSQDTEEEKRREKTRARLTQPPPACARVAADGGANSLYQAAGAHGDPCFVSPRVSINRPLTAPSNLPLHPPTRTTSTPSSATLTASIQKPATITSLSPQLLPLPLPPPPLAGSRPRKSSTSPNKKAPTSPKPSPTCGSTTSRRLNNKTNSTNNLLPPNLSTSSPWADSAGAWTRG